MVSGATLAQKMKAASTVPNHLLLPQAGLCLSSHATTPTIAIGLSSGGLVVSPFPPSSSAAPATITHPFQAPCRATAFLPSSEQLLASSSKDSSLLKDSTPNVLVFDATTPKALHSYTLKSEADGNGASATVFTPISATLALAGDENGGLHLLDTRVAEKACAWTLDQADYISAIHPVTAFGTSAILASSGDGTLCAYDMRTGPHARLKLEYATDSFQDDLLSMAVLPEANCVIAGTLAGAINVYSLSLLDQENEMDESRLVERFFGHPECVNAVVGVGKDGLALTASTDGVVRVIDVQAKKLVGVLDYAKEVEVSGETNGRKRKKKRSEEAWPIESMVSVVGLSKPGFALLGHDEMIRFCDGSVLVDDDEEKDGNDVDDGVERVKEEESEDDGDLEWSRKKKKKKKKREVFEPKRKEGKKRNFFSDL